MSKTAPTLADALLRQTFTPPFRRLDKENWFRRHINEARRFVLDDAMSAFSADLAYANFKFMGRHAARDQAIMDGLRILSRLPHKVTWIELNLKARVIRAGEYGALNEMGMPIDPEKSPDKLGWLLVQHPQIETAFMAVECVSHASRKLNFSYADPLEEYATPNPLTWFWRTDDGPPAWSGYDDDDEPIHEKFSPGEWLTGVRGYRHPSIGFMRSPCWPDGHFNPKELVRSLHQSGSDLRYLWALLAAINDVPIGYESVRQSKGFVARGSYRKFLDHTVIRLLVPHRVSLRTLALRVARAARRRAHMVRGHWRRNWRKDGEKIWIKEHQRGDASLGFVTHDYAVQHEEEGTR